MATVRISIKGMMKCYRLKRKRVKSRIKKLGIKPAGGYKGFRLYTEADAKAVGDYRKNRAIAKKAREEQRGHKHKRRRVQCT